ncbi:MAG TPA: helix-hairpin-helix domain-containing protein [Polyangiales bacterium]
MANADPKAVQAPTQEVESKSPHDGNSSVGALDLNAASEAQIAEIDLIGRRLARAIVARRAARGPFSNWDDLLDVEGLEPKKLAELQRAARIIVS